MSMKFISNMPSQKKLNTTFFITVILLIILAAAAVFLIHVGAGNMSAEAQRRASNISQITAFQVDFAEARLLIAQNPQAADSVISALISRINLLAQLQPAVYNASQADALRHALEQYRADVARASDGTSSANDVNAVLSSGLSRAQSLHRDGLADGQSSATQSALIISAAALLSIIIILIFASALGKGIGTPVAALADAAEKIAGSERFNLAEIQSNDEMGRLYNSLIEIHSDLSREKQEHKQLAQTSSIAISDLETELRNMHTSMIKFAEGDFAAPSFYGQKSDYKLTTDVLASVLRDISSNIAAVAVAVAVGNFNQEIDAEKYNGTWRKLAQEIARINNIAAPIMQTKELCDNFASGRFDGKITADAQGNLLQLKTAANSAAAALSKYASAIEKALEDPSRSRISTELPGEFAPIKAAITGIADQIKKDAVSSIASDSAAKKKFAPPATNSRKMSGAAKFARPIGGVPDYMRSDFGKY